MTSKKSRSPRRSADDLKRLQRDTGALLVEATHAIAARTAARVGSQDDGPDADATLAPLRAALRDARAALSDPARVSEHHRFVCNALRLYRTCARARCRRASACRGNACACFETANVPEPVLDCAALMLLTAQVPALAPLARTPGESRAAYEGWIAGMEARR
jgi:hypothetical protein